MPGNLLAGFGGIFATAEYPGRHQEQWIRCARRGRKSPLYENQALQQVNCGDGIS